MAPFKMKIDELQSFHKALESLRHQRAAALRKLAEDNTAANRAEFREIQDTISTLRSVLHVEHGLVARILKALHLPL